jgi:hypothetical protein
MVTLVMGNTKDGFNKRDCELSQRMQHSEWMK